MNPWSYLAEAVRFAETQTMLLTAPPGAVRIRALVWPKVALGGIVGRLFHSLSIPFQWTPLLALPWSVLGAFALYRGQLWLGVLLSFAVVVFDIGDGVATGWALRGVAEGDRPLKKLWLRRFLDSYVVDTIAHFLLYFVFALRLYEEGQVSFGWLLTLIALEIGNVLLANGDELRDRKNEFFYEFVLDFEAEQRFRPFYVLRVLLGHLTAYHGYSLLPLLGYLAPLRAHGLHYFVAVFGVRSVSLAGRLLRAIPRREPSAG
jgi:hypothetical protein